MLPYLLLAGSVCAHVCWNVLARRQQPSSDFLWWAVLCYCLVTAPLLGQAALWQADVWPCMLVTGVLNGVYFIALGHAYQRMPAAVVYPIARSSPLLLVLIDITVLAVPLAMSQLVAIILASCGILMLARSLPVSGNWAGIGLALLAAAATTGYTLSDQHAARAGIDSVPLGLGYVCGTYSIAWLMMSCQRRLQGQRCCPPAPPVVITVIGALCVGSAYALVIGALRFLPAAITVTWTNTGVIIGVILAMVCLRERQRIALRLVAVGLTVGGLVLLALGS